MAGEIVVGNEATDRTAAVGSEQTTVNKDNPASVSGSIKTVKIYTLTAMKNVKVATFFVVSGNNLSTRAVATIADGQVTAGYSEHIVDIEIQSGDFIGYCGTTDNASGIMDTDTSGGNGVWNTSGLHIPCTNLAFTLFSVWKLSLQGIGDTPALAAGGTPVLALLNSGVL